MNLELNRVSVRHPGQGRDGVSEVSLQLAAGEIGVLLGPSGCGKTTLLRCIAGLHSLSGGEIYLGGRCLSDVHGSVPVQQRGLGMVFQDYALFPHLNVARNVGFGLNGLSTELRQARVEHALAMVALSEMHMRYPHELSGGQQQRVALARAMAVRPQLLLLDEPFSSLDVSLRQQLAQSLRQLLKQQNMTALMVTHDQDEAFALGDQMGVMFDGVLHQWADPRRVYEHPATAEVAQFIGQGAWLRVEPLRGQSGQGWESALGHWPATRGGVFGDRAWLRAQDVLVGSLSSRRAQVLSSYYRGADMVCQLQLATGEHMVALVDPSQRLACGAWVGVSIKP